MTEPEHGNAYEAIRHLYRNSPGQSWRRLNSALQKTLSAAIEAHLSFEPDDFRDICRDFTGGYWMGSSQDAVTGEHYYSDAVECGHTQACISFERYAGRPAILWSETAKTPKRLHVGSEFTWQGMTVEVTSIQQDHLIACSYSRDRWRSDENGTCIGSLERLADGQYRQVEGVSGDLVGPLSVNFSAPVEDPYARKIERRIKITFEELAAVRKVFEKARREALKAIAGAADKDALTAVKEEIAAKPAGTYRHFDIEDIREAIREREKAIEKEAYVAGERARQDEERRLLAASYDADLKAWMDGAPARQWFHDVRLRVKDERVETSTGQSASLQSVRKVLPVILRRRDSFGPVCNLKVDSYPVVEHGANGVKVGCTLVPWGEVERLQATLKQLAEEGGK